MVHELKCQGMFSVIRIIVGQVHSGSDLLGSSEKAFSSVMLNKDCPGTHIHDQKDF